jgi:hypothetical protein
MQDEFSTAPEEINVVCTWKADRFGSRRETHPYESGRTPEEREAEEYSRYFEQRSDEAVRLRS